MLDLLPAFGHLNPRLAAFLMIVLLVGAAIPLALAWTRILPAEREPFARPDLPRVKGKVDSVALFFLLNVSLSLVAAIPRIADTLRLDILLRLLPEIWAEHVTMVALIWLVFIPALTAAYSAVRANPIRIQLMVGGIVVLALWLLSPTLLGSLVTRP
ncbi:MAG: hypothetical protein NVS9B14_19610 [Candidatus Acidiferrum sp.]